MLAKNILKLITLSAIGFAIYAYFNPILWIFRFTSSDALLHVTGFAIVCCLTVFTLPSVKRGILLFWMCSVSVLAEVAQPLLTRKRELSLSDIGANGLGVLIGVGLASASLYATSQIIGLIKKKKNPRSAAL